MSKTITLTTLDIQKVTIDIASRQAYVQYILRDDSGFYSRTGTAIFTRPLPDNPPDDTFLLNSVDGANILTLLQDIQAAMIAKLLS